MLSTISTRKSAYGQSPLIPELVREVAEAGKAAARVFCCSALDQATALVTKMTPDVHPYDYDLVVIGGGVWGPCAFPLSLCRPLCLVLKKKSRSFSNTTGTLGLPASFLNYLISAGRSKTSCQAWGKGSVP